MAERFKATVLKTVVRESVPWVRIPLSPPLLRRSLSEGELTKEYPICHSLSEDELHKKINSQLLKVNCQLERCLSG